MKYLSISQTAENRELNKEEYAFCAKREELRVHSKWGYIGQFLKMRKS